VALMESLAADLKGTGVRVNSILPSIMDTPANRAAMPNPGLTMGGGGMGEGAGGL